MAKSSELLFGTECEFLFLRNGSAIWRLAAPIIGDCDLIGVDGHRETLEIRTAPTSSAVTQFAKLASSMRKFSNLLRYTGLVGSTSTNNTIISSGLEPVCVRGGAFCRTPLGIHLHYSGFSPHMKYVHSTLCLLHEVLIKQYLDRVGPLEELKRRKDSGYGTSEFAAYRIKLGGWWEWREPFSCLTPPHMAVLLAGAELIGRVVVTSNSLDSLKTLHAELTSLTLPLSLLKLYTLLPAEDRRLILWDLEEIVTLARKLLKLGRITWSKDLLPLWVNQRQQ